MPFLFHVTSFCSVILTYFFVLIPVPAKEFEYDFHIIYSGRKETEWVEKTLLRTLEKDHGLKCCIGLRDFVVGRSIIDNMRDFIFKSRKNIAVVSNGFLKSTYCLAELQLVLSALRQRGDESLIFIIIDEVEMNRLPTILNKRNTIDLTTSEKTLKEELFPFLEVGNKQGGCVYISVRECTTVF